MIERLVPTPTPPYPNPDTTNLIDTQSEVSRMNYSKGEKNFRDRNGSEPTA